MESKFPENCLALTGFWRNESIFYNLKQNISLVRNYHDEEEYNITYVLKMNGLFSIDAITGSLLIKISKFRKKIENIDYKQLSPDDKLAKKLLDMIWHWNPRKRKDISVRLSERPLVYEFKPKLSFSEMSANAKELFNKVKQCIDNKIIKTFFYHPQMIQMKEEFINYQCAPNGRIYFFRDKGEAFLKETIKESIEYAFK